MSNNPWIAKGGVQGEEYDAKFEELADAGEDVHGEASFVESLSPRSVLDAGCGTGRVAIELSRRGIDVVGVDLDPKMLSSAQTKAPQMDWRLGDLATVDLGRRFDVVVMAGNVMIFLEAGTEAAAIANMERHLAPGGSLVAGFQIGLRRFPGGNPLTLATYDESAAQAGLELSERWATWDRQPFVEGGDYAVSVHRRRTAP